MHVEGLRSNSALDGRAHSLEIRAMLLGIAAMGCQNNILA